ncbi:MAG: ferredoxin-type protein NapG, partial [Chloroflexi bacterium]
PYETLHLATAAMGVAIGTPYFVARQVPCYLCQGYDELRCTVACPTGALEPTSAWTEVHIGIAVLDREMCLAWQGIPCRACWHVCPFPNEAIVLDERGRAIVQPEACVGCGLCEHACLAEPSAIVIIPEGREPL